MSENDPLQEALKMNVEAFTKEYDALFVKYNMTTSIGIDFDDRLPKWFRKFLGFWLRKIIYLLRGKIQSYIHPK